MKALLLSLSTIAILTQAIPALAAPFLIGGKVAKQDEFKSSVWLSLSEKLCSGVKIGPRLFMTAAHCVMDKKDKQSDQPGTKVFISTHTGVEMKTTMTKVVVHPNYLKELKRLKSIKSYLKKILEEEDIDLQAYASFKSPGIVIFTIADFSPKIEIAQIDFSPVMDDEKIFITGSGYDNEEYSEQGILRYGTATNRYRISEDYNHSDAAREAFGYSVAYKNNLMFSLSKSQLSFGSGDAGGAAFRAETKKLVGINSTQAEYTDEGRLPIIIAQAVRLEKQFQWLKSESSNFGELDSIIEELSSQRKADNWKCGIEIFYKLMDFGGTSNQLTKGCKDKDLVELESLHKTLKLERLASISEFNLDHFNSSWKRIAQKAKENQAIIQGNGDVPSNFVVTPEFYFELLTNHGTAGFTKLVKRNLLTVDQTLSFIDLHGAQASEIISALGEGKYLNSLVNLSQRSSENHIFKTEEFWKELVKSKINLKEKAPGINLAKIANSVMYKEGIETGYTLMDFLDAKVKLTDLTSNSRFSKKQLIDSGVGYMDFINEFSVKDLIEAGGSYSEIKKQNIPIKTLVKQGFKEPELMKCGYIVRDVLAEVGSQEMLKIGYSIKLQVQAASLSWDYVERTFTKEQILNEYSFRDLIKNNLSVFYLTNQYEMTAAQAKAENIPLLLLHKSFTPKELILGGYTIKDLYNLYCSMENSPCKKTSHRYEFMSTELKDFLGYLIQFLPNKAELNANGFTSKDIYLGIDYTFKDKQLALKSLHLGLKKDILGYYKEFMTPAEIKAMGFKKREIKKELKKIGIKLKNADFKMK